jgi:hypothetical protein
LQPTARILRATGGDLAGHYINNLNTAFQILRARRRGPVHQSLPPT